jgi:hypothetical protein
MAAQMVCKFLTSLTGTPQISAVTSEKHTELLQDISITFEDVRIKINYSIIINEIAICKQQLILPGLFNAALATFPVVVFPAPPSLRWSTIKPSFSRNSALTYFSLAAMAAFSSGVMRTLDFFTSCR